MKILITNLPWSTDRRKHMEDQMKKINLEYEFTDCVIGNDLTDEDLNIHCNMDVINSLNEKKFWFNKGMIGCTMTHQRNLKRMISEDHNQFILLEDDTILPNNFLEIVSDSKIILKPGQVCLLFLFGWDTVKLKAIESDTITKFYKILNPEIVSGGSAVIFTKEAAIQCLKVNTPITITPDCWGDFIKLNAISELICAYPLPLDTKDFKSTMNIGVISRIVNSLGIHKLPILKQLLTYKRMSQKKNRQNFELI